MKQAFADNRQLGPSSDAITLHPYPHYPPRVGPEDEDGGGGQLADKIGRIKATFAAGGVNNKPAWITELGWPTGGVLIQGDSEGEQARWLIRAIVLAALNGIDLFYIYDMYDTGTSVNPEGHFGLLRVDGKPKPAYAAIQQFIRTLGRYRVQGRLPVHGPKNSVYVVQMVDDHGRQAWVVWDSIESGTGFKWKLPANTTCSGFLPHENCTVSNGELVVTSTPVYVTAR